METVSAAASVSSLLRFTVGLYDGFVRYYELWDTKDDTIAETIRRLENLKLTLENFSDPVSKLSSSKVHHAAASHLNGLKTQLDIAAYNLRQFVEIFKIDQPPATFTERLQVSKTKAAYLFQSKTLKTMNHTIDLIERSLALANDALQLNVQCELFNQGHYVYQSLEDLHRISSQNGNLLRGIETSLFTSNIFLNDLSSTIPELFFKVDQLLHHTKLQSQNFYAPNGQFDSICNASKPPMSRLDGMKDLLQPLLISPVMSGCQRPLEHGLVREVISKPSFQNELCEGLCLNQWRSSKQGCPRKQNTRPKQRQQMRLRSIIFFRQRENRKTHCNRCRTSLEEDEATVYGIRIDSLRWFLARTIEVAFRWQRGAGGVSISASLQVRRIFRPDSAMFKLFERFQNNHRNRAVRVSDIKKLFPLLQKYFEEGKASPYDVNAREENIFHLTSQFRLEESGDIDLELIRSICKGFLEIHVPSMEPDRDGRTPTGVLFDNDFHCNLLDTFDNVAQISVDLGVEAGVDRLCVGRPPTSLAAARNGILTPALFRLRCDEIEEFQVGPLSRAVLSRSEADLTIALTRWPEALSQERSCFGHTVLHFAVDWPRGLELLLAAGAAVLLNVTDCGGHTVFMNAFCRGHEESLQMILREDHICFSDSWLLENLGKLKVTPRMRQMACDVLYTKRESLSAFAKIHLPPGVCKTLLAVPDGMLDENIDKVYEKLSRKRVLVPEYLQRSDERVYFSPIQQESAELLWRRRFFDINVFDWQKGTALAFQLLKRNLPVATWLMSKGAQFRPPSPKHAYEDENPPFGLEHYIAHALPILNTKDVSLLCDPQRAISALKVNVQDGCSCFCSLDGCTPLMIFLKEATRQDACPEDCSSLLNLAFSSGISLEASLEIIRFATFHVLELRHTCCQNLCPRMDGCEVMEIHEEETFLIEQLHGLVNEFIRHYRNAKISLSDFFRSIWRNKIEEALKDSALVNDESLRSFRSIGVAIRPPKQEELDDDEDTYGLDDPLNQKYDETDDDNPIQMGSRRYPKIDFWLRFCDRLGCISTQKL